MKKENNLSLFLFSIIFITVGLIIVGLELLKPSDQYSHPREKEYLQDVTTVCEKATKPLVATPVSQKICECVVNVQQKRLHITNYNFTNNINLLANDVVDCQEQVMSNYLK